MADLSHLSDDDLLRLAIRDALAERTSTSDFELGQIHAAFVAGNGEREMIWLGETAPGQAEFDLHLGGPNVLDHTTNARNFASFVAGISETVKETAKAKAGRKNYSENLLIEGAIPGSVRVVLRAPEPVQKYPSDNNPDIRFGASTVDSDALRQVASVFALASDLDPEAPLYSELRDMPAAARESLKRIANLTTKAGWEISGLVRQREFGADAVSFGPAAATRLKLELEAIPEETFVETVIGRLDGFRRSLGTVYVIPDNGRAVPVAVQTAALLRRVSALAADPETRVTATVEVVTSTVQPGDEKRAKVSRTLLSIEKRETLGAQLDIGSADQ